MKTLGRWLGRLWRFLVGVKNVTVTLVVLFALFVGLRLLFQNEAPQIPGGGAVLRLTLDGAIVEQTSAVDPRTALTSVNTLPHQTRLRDILLALDRASTDSRIKAVSLELDGLESAGPAALEAIGTALEAFKHSNKPIIAHGVEFSDRQYHLAAHANEISLDPMGGLLLKGYGSYNLYLKDALDRLKVTVNVFRVGKYKSFVEPYTRNDMSPEAREADIALLDTLWQGYTTEVEAARGKGFKVKSFIEQMASGVPALKGDVARYALNAKAVDRIEDTQSFVNDMRKRYGDGKDDDGQTSFAQISLADYVTIVNPVVRASGPAVAVVTAAGEIVDGDHNTGVAAGDTIERQIHRALNDSDTKALVLRVDSPGGSVFASEQIRRALLEAKERHIPVVASMGTLAASGGYWISTAAEEIWAEPTTITGSIGIFALIPTFENTLGIASLHSDGVGTTPYSGIEDLTKPFSSEIKAVLQSTVENGYTQFLTRVAEARHLTSARVDEIGQGRVWAGSTAKELKLVDRIGGLTEAIASAATKAGLKNWRVNHIEEPESITNQLLSMLTNNTEASGHAVIPHNLRLLVAKLLHIGEGLGGSSTLFGPRNLYAWCIECEVLAPAPTHSLMALSPDQLLGLAQHK